MGVCHKIKYYEKYLCTKVPRCSGGSSDGGGGTYIRVRKRVNYLNSAHHYRPKQARLLRHGSSVVLHVGQNIMSGNFSHVFMCHWNAISDVYMMSCDVCMTSACNHLTFHFS